MQIFAETERTILREMLPEDAEALFAMDSDDVVHRFLGNKPLQKIEEARNIIAFIRRQYRDHGIGRWAVIEKKTGNFIGWSGLKFVTTTTNGHVNYYDLGYRFAKSSWGLGFATETALATLEYGFGNMLLKEIFAIADCNNTGSDRVLRKAGLRCINTFSYDGVPHRWYEMNTGEWELKGRHS